MDRDLFCFAIGNPKNHQSSNAADDDTNPRQTYFLKASICPTGTMYKHLHICIRTNKVIESEVYYGYLYNGEYDFINIILYYERWDLITVLS